MGFAQGQKATCFDLESQPDRQRLENPELMLGDLHGIAILDEFQEMPELFSALRVIVDRPDGRLRFVVLGSASPHIAKGASETLAEVLQLDHNHRKASATGSWYCNEAFPMRHSRNGSAAFHGGVKGEGMLVTPPWKAALPA
jgi:hypothetical protein